MPAWCVCVCMVRLPAPSKTPVDHLALVFQLFLFYFFPQQARVVVQQLAGPLPGDFTKDPALLFYRWAPTRFHWLWNGNILPPTRSVMSGFESPPRACIFHEEGETLEKQINLFVWWDDRHYSDARAARKCLRTAGSKDDAAEGKSGNGRRNCTKNGEFWMRLQFLGCRCCVSLHPVAIKKPFSIIIQDIRVEVQWSPTCGLWRVNRRT